MNPCICCGNKCVTMWSIVYPYVTILILNSTTHKSLFCTVSLVLIFFFHVNLAWTCMFKRHQLLCVLHHCFWHSSTDINTPRVNNLQHCLVLSWTQLTTCCKSPTCKANSSSAKKFPTFYGTKGSLSCWQEPVTCPYHALPLHFFTNHLTVVPLSMSTSCVCSLSLRFSH